MNKTRGTLALLLVAYGTGALQKKKFRDVLLYRKGRSLQTIRKLFGIGIILRFFLLENYHSLDSFFPTNLLQFEKKLELAPEEQFPKVQQNLDGPHFSQ